ncbi:MAG: hypothetical protein EOP04_20050 [Proteobacteria bacterium]|nr:MAG: hypothetical protein EOP04_20050 [Pseudomonadota bacterium]
MTVFCFSVSGFAAQGRYFYVLQQSEIVSDVAYRAGLRPLYTRDGVLYQIRKLNPQIKNLDVVYPGTKIYLSDEMAQRSEELGLLRKTSGRQVYLQKSSSSQATMTQESASGKAVSEEGRAEPAPVTRTREEEPATKKPETVPQKERVGLQLYAAAGINYVLYEEKLADVTSRHRDLRGPSTNLGIAMEINETHSLEADLKTIPMQFDNSSAGLGNLNGNWQVLGIHGRYKPSASGLSWVYGAQVHKMPLALFQTVGNVPTLRNIQLLNFSLGARYDHLLNPFTRTQILLHGQYPASAQTSSDGARLGVSPVFAFDGSVGLEKRVFTESWVGLFWYGQFQQIKFDYFDPQVSATGAHTVFFSNIEARWTYEF